MVLNRFSYSHDFPSLFDNLFFNWPESPKPPLDSFPIKEENDLLGWEIQMALSGYTEDDVKVWHENQVLHIEGDNTKKDFISPKFKSAFHHKIAVSRDLDVSAAEVKLEEGILSVRLPVNITAKTEGLLFGKPPNKRLAC